MSARSATGVEIRPTDRNSRRWARSSGVGLSSSSPAVINELDVSSTCFRSIGLRPLEWSSVLRLAEQGAPYIGDVLESALRAEQAVIVLMTPDDVLPLVGRRSASFKARHDL